MHNYLKGRLTEIKTVNKINLKSGSSNSRKRENNYLLNQTNMNLKKISCLLSLFVLTFYSCNNQTKQADKEKELSTDTAAAPPAAAPAQQSLSLSDIELTDLSGKKIDLNSYAGKTVFLNLWATWCGPCVREMPSIQAAKKNFEKNNIVFITASDESYEQIENFREKHGYNMNFLRLENMGQLNISVIPTTYIFNPKGELVFNEVGYRKWDNKENLDIIQNSLN